MQALSELTWDSTLELRILGTEAQGWCAARALCSKRVISLFVVRRHRTACPLDLPFVLPLLSPRHLQSIVAVLVKTVYSIRLLCVSERTLSRQAHKLLPSRRR